MRLIAAIFAVRVCAVLIPVAPIIKKDLKGKYEFVNHKTDLGKIEYKKSK